MSSEILAVPEEHLVEVCKIIRAGIKVRKNTTPEVRRNLLQWCEEEEEYVRQSGVGDDEDE